MQPKLEKGLKAITDPELKASYQRKYSGSIKDIDSSVQSADLVANYRKERLTGAHSFKGLDDKPMSEKLLASDSDAQLLRQQIENALKLTDTTNNALTDFEKQVAEFNSKPHALMEVASKIQAFRTTLGQEIGKQHKQEKDNLNGLLNNSGFINTLASKLGVDPAQIDQLKSKMQTELKEAQEKELAAVDNALDKQVQRLMNELALEQARIGALALFYHSADANKMRADIDELAKKNYKPGHEGQVSIDGKTGLTKFKGINFKDIAHLQTATGRDVTLNGENEFSMNFPKIGLLYFRNKALVDLTSIAIMVRASGADKITLSVTHDKEEDAMELGRKAYEGALLAGFNPNTAKGKNVAIKVNGKLVEVDKLFEKCPSRRQLIEQKAADNKKVDHSLNPAEKQRDMKRELGETKKEKTGPDNQEENRPTKQQRR
ncbi:coiled coil domain protein [Legionella busanensis]|uniref:Coiled coil domain protein n=1 Tax=Legionella busanensis TaxID=190655 RepID=A0A378JVL2_9GAMM|nr:hypothetical protein [Legionella busanensis]STX52242.1 coiled coil domain protein [Legionella busanensis]